MSIDRGINKCGTCIQWNITQSLKSERTPLAATWMGLDIVVLSEVSQREGEMAHDIPYMWSLKRNNANDLIYETETDSQTREQTYRCQWGKNGGRRWELGIGMYTLLYLEWIHNKDLLYSTRNSGQWHMAAWMGGELRGEWIHVYVWLSPFAVYLKLSQHR